MTLAFILPLAKKTSSSKNAKTLSQCRENLLEYSHEQGSSPTPAPSIANEAPRGSTVCTLLKWRKKSCQIPRNLDDFLDSKTTVKNISNTLVRYTKQKGKHKFSRGFRLQILTLQAKAHAQPTLSGGGNGIKNCYVNHVISQLSTCW